jgi:hypothetical protein
MVEPVNNNVYNVDMMDKAKSGMTSEVQKDSQVSAATTELQNPKKPADTVTISKEAVEAQKGAAKTAPEQERVKSMQEGQNPANQGAAKNNPKEALVQAYGVSK